MLLIVKMSICKVNKSMSDLGTLPKAGKWWFLHLFALFQSCKEPTANNCVSIVFALQHAWVEMALSSCSLLYSIIQPNRLSAHPSLYPSYTFPWLSLDLRQSPLSDLQGSYKMTLLLLPPLLADTHVASSCFIKLLIPWTHNFLNFFSHNSNCLCLLNGSDTVLKS